METTYLFSKESREEIYDYDTAYCFRLRRKGWIHLNKKATKLIEHDDHYEVKLADRYINVGDKHIGAIIKRQQECSDLQDYYYFLKNIKDD